MNVKLIAQTEKNASKIVANAATDAKNTAIRKMAEKMLNALSDSLFEC